MCARRWDRTAQLSTLAQIMLDPQSRTFSGFMAVIHKEWLSFGHKFEDRLGTLHQPRREVSPVFTQCLDCVWQLMRQNPNAFEFDSSFLAALHYAVHTSEYGTFLCNSEKERLVDHKLHTRTRCLWRAMSRVAPKHANLRYTPVPGVLSVSTDPEASTPIAFFAQLYMPRCLPRDTLHNPSSPQRSERAAGDGGCLPRIHAVGGDPEWPRIVTVTPPPSTQQATDGAE